MENSVILYVGEICNNNCIMCSVKGDDRNTISYSSLSKKLEKNRSRANEASFTGGEPTEHPDIIELFKKAKSIGYEKISMSTNGRNLADQDFAKNLIASGLTGVSITIHGPEEIHNKITQTNSYKEAMRGIENLQKESVSVAIDSVVIGPNINHLQNLWKMLHNIGIRIIGFQDLVPEGGAKINPEKLMIPYKNKKDLFYNNLELLRRFNLLVISNFPRCVLPVSLPENFLYTSQFEKEKSWQFDGLGNTGTETFKGKIEMCKKCPYQEKCYGFRKENLEKFGEEGVKEMMKIDSFIEESNKVFKK